ncbi:hypothetical protein NCCP1664_10700 [Zafaria cholistanensis]|uniref:M23ase beta-sheet core domain-containing protein n=1 Tax=Zafaria cholistanensis TaxID=1682741 RepID=A0A5A7NNQ9_9MICC|nr:M23 family metallopeptidase [Zafaria cholistanensis]GER22573.1 hypothetical protein NCCP1664_10700 [Zafaria cholistanensis]
MIESGSIESGSIESGSIESGSIGSGPGGGGSIGDGRRPAGAWSWPVADRGGAPPAVLKAFDPPAHDWLAGHRGADLEAAAGDTVRAPAAGTVAFAGTVVDRPVLTIDHGNGLLSSFEPVDGTPPAGTAVPAGAAVGRVGAGGHCGGRCVHWGLRLEGVYIDPLDTVADRRPSVLLPVPKDGR